MSWAIHPHPVRHVLQHHHSIYPSRHLLGLSHTLPVAARSHFTGSKVFIAGSSSLCILIALLQFFSQLIKIFPQPPNKNILKEWVQTFLLTSNSSWVIQSSTYSRISFLYSHRDYYSLPAAHFHVAECSSPQVWKSSELVLPHYASS